MNNLLAQLSRKFLTDLNRHSQMFASPPSIIFIYCLKQIPVVLQTERAQKCESSQMYFFLFLSELKKEEKNIILNNSVCSEVEILMTRLQVRQHYGSVAIWQDPNRTS